MRIEYSVGESALHRAYYCPSLILDIIHGNTKRGRATKKKPIGTDYVYGFDCENRLITVDRGNQRETILYDGCYELGLMKQRELIKYQNVFMMNQAVSENVF